MPRDGYPVICGVWYKCSTKFAVLFLRPFRFSGHRGQADGRCSSVHPLQTTRDAKKHEKQKARVLAC